MCVVINIFVCVWTIHTNWLIIWKNQTIIFPHDILLFKYEGLLFHIHWNFLNIIIWFICWNSVITQIQKYSRLPNWCQFCEIIYIKCTTKIYIIVHGGKISIQNMFRNFVYIWAISVWILISLDINYCLLKRRDYEPA